MKYAVPFPHAVIDGFLSPEVVREINAQWPSDEHWKKEDGRATRKWSTNALPPAARAVVDAFDVGVVEDAIGVPGILPDPDGGALHAIPRGGFLNMHYDFNIHAVKGWRRRANALIYLNEVWDDAWNGHLQLGLKDEKLIAPLGGRCVIFETNKRSWHGHPLPLMCPPDKQRRSLAIYVYTDDADPAEKRHTTVYHSKLRMAA